MATDLMKSLLTKIATQFQEKAGTAVYVPLNIDGKFEIYFCLDDDGYNNKNYILINHPGAFCLTLDDARALAQSPDCLNKSNVEFALGRIALFQPKSDPGAKGPGGQG